MLVSELASVKINISDAETTLTHPIIFLQRVQVWNDKKSDNINWVDSYSHDPLICKHSRSKNSLRRINKSSAHMLASRASHKELT